MDLILRSFLTCLLQTVCHAASANDMYSASVVDGATNRCFLVFKDTKQSWMKKHCPENERRSDELEAELASPNLVTVICPFDDLE